MHGIGDRDKIEAARRALAQETGATVHLSAADLTRPPEIRAMVADAERAMGGRVDVLVNNAGIQHVAPVHEFPEDKWDAILAVILSSTFHATKAALPGMVARNWGRVINTGSMHATVASPYKSAYNAAKHGVAGFTRTAALELARTGVTVNAICPGYCLTDLVRGQLKDTARARGMAEEDVIEKVMLADQPTRRFVDTDDVGALAVHLCGPHSASITGALLAIDGGWTAR
jgi:3-hydroxybutyrate dehydrogenase